jgi:phosphate transport system substrate-binding protein
VLYRWVAAWLALALLCACATPAPPTLAPQETPVSLVVSCSTETAPLVVFLGRHLEARRPHVEVTFEVEDVERGLQRLGEGEVELVAVAGWPPEELWSAPLAIDGIAVVVHPDNPLQNLTLAQLYDVFYGRVWRWSELGVEVVGDEIAVVSREEESRTRAAFEARVMTHASAAGGECSPAAAAQPAPSRYPDDARPELAQGATPLPPCQADPVTANAVIMAGSADVVAYVAAHSEAIGYVSQGYVSAEAGVKALRLEGAPPDPPHIADGSYPLIQPFFLVARREPSGAARLFVDLSLSEEGQALIAAYYAPVRH